MDSVTDPVSVIIPAHNEAAVIERGIRALTEGAEPGEIQVIVVANGCTDDTAAIAKKFDAYPVTVIDTPEGGKPGALNLGDEAATGFPRIYADADVDLTIDGVRAIRNALSGEGGRRLHLVSPRMRIDLTARPWTVRAYYAVWTRLPYYKHKIGGVYAMSRAGRARFDRFPDLIADDTFAAVQFEPSEQTVLDTCSFRMTPPKTLAQLVHIEVRRRSGSDQLAGRYPELMSRRRADQQSGLRRLLWRVDLWPALAVYAYVKLAARARLRRARAQGNAEQWNRDESSR